MPIQNIIDFFKALSLWEKVTAGVIVAFILSIVRSLYRLFKQAQSSQEAEKKIEVSTEEGSISQTVAGNNVHQEMIILDGRRSSIIRDKLQQYHKVRPTPGKIIPEPDGPTISLTSYSADIEEFKSCPWWVCCCPIKDVSSRSLRIQPTIGSNDSFFKTEDFDRVVHFLESKRDVLIYGMPKSGKTRLAFEAMRKFDQAWLLYLKPALISGEDISPRDFSIPRLPAQIPLAFLFYDDLEKYHEIQDPDGLLMCLDPNRTVAVITVRNDPEYNKAKRVFCRAINKLDKVKIQTLDETAGEDIAKQAGITNDWQNGFDGTIGWIMLGPRAKKEVFDSWKEHSLPRAILQSCKLLRKCGIYTYREEEVQNLSINVFEANADESNWREGIHLLDETGFLLKGSRVVDASGELDIYDAHLDDIVNLNLDIVLFRQLIMFWALSGNRENLESLSNRWQWDESEQQIIIRAIQQCIERDSNRALYHHLIANLVDEEKTETIERRKAIEIEPDNGEWNFALGDCLRRYNNSEAEVWLRKAYFLKPTSKYANALGDILATFPEHQKEAISFYEAALKHDTENQEARWSLAKLLNNDPNQIDRVCDLVIAVVKNASYLYYETSEIPSGLSQLPRWREFWIDHQINESLDNWYLCDEEEIRQLDGKGWITAEQINHRYEEAISTKIAEVKGDEDKLSELVNAIESIYFVFCHGKTKHPVAHLALETIRHLHNSFPKNENVAECLIGILGDEGMNAQTARPIRSYCDEARCVRNKFPASSEIAYRWAQFLVVLTANKNSEEIIQLFDGIINELEDLARDSKIKIKLPSGATEQGLQEQIAWALVNKGATLSELKRNEEEIEVYNQVVTRFGEATEPGLQEQVARALVNKGATLSELKRNEEAIEVYNRVVAQFSDATEPGLQEQVARALVNKGATLSELKRNEEEIEVYNQVVAQFSDATESGLQEQVARALVYKGATLSELKRNEEAIEVYNQVVTRFGEATEPGLQEQVAWALVYKGATLSELKRNEEEIEVYNQVVTRFGEATEPGLQEQVAWAFASRGWLYYEKDDLDGFLKDTETALSKTPSLDYAAFNLGLALLAKGFDVESLNSYSRAGGKFPHDIEALGLADLEKAKGKWLTSERAQPVINLLQSIKKLSEKQNK